MEKILFSGSADKKSAEKLAKLANLKFGKIIIKKFACGKIYVQLLENVSQKKFLFIKLPLQIPIKQF